MTKNWMKAYLALAGTLLTIGLPALAASTDAPKPTKPRPSAASPQTASPQTPVNTSGDAKRPAELILPSTTLQRTGDALVKYHLSEGYTGHAVLHLRWTDSLGRIVEDKTIQSDLIDETEIPFHIDLSQAVAMRNHLEADLSLDGKGVSGKPYKIQESAQADFIAQPPFTGWRDYAIMMWQDYPANLIPALHQLGVNGATYSSRLIHLPDFLIDTNTRWYSESIATDFYSEYHRWRPDRKVGWSFDQAKELYKQDPNSLDAFKRHPSFWDPYWRKMIHDRALATAQRLAPYRPYFYSLADESGIGELEQQWDFDFSDESLVPMRRWLQSVYGNLGALNEEWGTHYTDWNLVMPLTTNQAMKQPGDNFSQWADFKEWMDISYADALKMGMDAVHEGDPHAYVGVGGGQQPGWGGYNYDLITKALNQIEPYDIGRNVDIIHSLNPKMVLLSTGFASGPWEEHRVWYELIHGERGLIIWDQDHAYVQKDGQPGPRGLAASKYYNEIRNGEGALIINSQVVSSPIAIHYSQPSFRTDWILERRPDGDAWMTRPAEYERSNNNFIRLRESWCNLIQDEGLQYTFVSHDQIPQGGLLKRGYHVLILPDSTSLSRDDANGIREFVAGGGVVIASGMPGTDDEHSKKLPQSSLADLFAGNNSQQVNEHNFGKGKAILLNTDIVSYLQNRLDGKEGPVHHDIGELLRANGIHPQFVVEDAAGHSVVGIDKHVFTNGGVRIVTLQSNPQARVSELGPPDFRKNDRFSKPVSVHLRLPGTMYVYDTLARKSLGQQKDLSLTVDPYKPTILAVSDTPLPEMQVSVPDHAQRGSTVDVAVNAGPALANANIFHVGVQDPQGKNIDYYSGNLIANQGAGVKTIPFASNDTTGTWTITVQDMLSGQTETRKVDVE